MDSSEMAGTTSNSTRRSASSCIVQRSWPSGGLVQAKAIVKACCLGVSFGAAPGRGRSVRAASSPASTNRWRVRATVESPLCSAAAIASSVRPSAASKSVWARRTDRAAAFPFRVSAWSRSRSSTVNVTRYRFATPSPPSRSDDHAPPRLFRTSVAEY
jgi:hypothetical protein